MASCTHARSLRRRSPLHYGRPPLSFQRVFVFVMVLLSALLLFASFASIGAHDGSSRLSLFKTNLFPLQPAHAMVRKRHGGGGGGGVYQAPLVSYTVPPYSLSSACESEMKQWCPFRTPFMQDAIHCFESYRSQLSPSCRLWHDARLACQSQIHARVREADESGHAAKNEEHDNNFGGGGGDERLNFHNDFVGGKVGEAPAPRRADDNDGNGQQQWAYHDQQQQQPPPRKRARLEKKDDGGAEKGCGPICQQYCGEGKSLLLCMRALGGKGLRSLVERSCYESAFAKSIVRSLNTPQHG